jgi:DNA repair protein RadA/Sms
LAIASAFIDRPVPTGAACFGELGLSGEVRPVSAAGRRIAEARRLGFPQLFVPTVDSHKKPPNEPGLSIIANLAAALRGVGLR